MFAVVMAITFFSCKPEPGVQNNVRFLSAVTDTNVILPPAWAFGMVYGAYTDQEQSINLIDQIITHDYPIDAFWIDSWFWDWQNKGQGPQKYIDFIADTISYPDMKGLWDFMEKKDIKAGIWLWDAIMKRGNEKVYEDFKSKGYFRRESIRTDGWHNGLRTTIIGDNSLPVKGTRCGDIDFENPEATAYFQRKIKHFFDDGLDFLKLDKTDAIPVCKAMFETTQKLGKETKGRGFILSHSGGTDRDEYKRYPGKWTDDERTDWTIDKPTHRFSPWLPKVAFKEVLAMYTDTSRHFYKIPFLANDMGGFAIGLDGKIDEELYIRWLEFAHFVPLTTPFSQPENPTGNIAFNISERADSLFRKYSHIKLKLFPYIYSYAHRSRLEGKNIIRPVRLYEYLFGEEILVAPVFVQGARDRTLYLPEGNEWVNYWTGDATRGGVLFTCEAPLEQIPLFVKQGAIIPMRKYARSVERGSNNLLELYIYTGSDGHFTLIEDDGTSNEYLKGIYATTAIDYHEKEKSGQLVIHPISGYFKGMENIREWKIILFSKKEIKKVSVNRHSLEFTITGNKYTVKSFSALKSRKQVVDFKYKM